MTRDEILALKPGEELDRLVAIHVFGEPEPPIDPKDPDIDSLRYLMQIIPRGQAWVLTDTGYDNGDDPKMYHRPFSRQIGIAWRVIEKINNQVFHIRNNFATELAKQFTTEDGKNMIAWPYAILHVQPEHICKAALLTMVPLG